MSSIGSPIDASVLQAAQAQQTASKARDRERAASERGRRLRDMVDLRVAALETADAVRRLPQNDSGEAEAEHDRESLPTSPPPPDEPPTRVDVQA
jgi:hypothetical protein